MTSSTSSSPLTDRSYRARFPPRSELPPGVKVEPLPMLGTTWYERGFLYRMRRIGIGLLFVVIAVVYPVMIEGALMAISAPGTPLYDGLAAGEIVFTAVSGVWLFRRMWRNSLNGALAGRSDTKAAGRLGGGLGSLAFTVGGALAGLFVLCSLFTAGLALASFAVWMVPMPPAEQYARRKMAERIQAGHKLQQLSPHSKHYGSKNHHKH